jgi:uncharacterized damage-inducible protein DinB
MPTSTSAPPVIFTPDQLLAHWQGHRRVTRRMIQAFPDDQLFSFSVGGMRPFSTLVLEFIGMAAPTLGGIINGKWDWYQPKASTKAELLALWDQTTAEIDRLFPQIPPGRFQEEDTAFGQWKMRCNDLLMYVIDNEIHHRGQGYVYLRALGVEPPQFPDRS